MLSRVFYWLSFSFLIFSFTALGEIDKSTDVFTGSDACKSCHVKEFEQWSLSQHKTALQSTSKQSVLGDFENTTFNYNGVSSRFYRQAERFMVETDGPDGQLKSYEIKYTIGDYPLQQYFLDFGKGRLQSLGVSWDSRPKSEGGQRWFHQQEGNKVDYASSLHWTSVQQNANLMCIECHTTDYKKNYNADLRSFDSQWLEMGAGCESCHGSGQKHIDWANNVSGNRVPGNKVPGNKVPRHKTPGNYVRKGLEADISNKNHWAFQPGQTTATAVEQHYQQQVETCTRCHSRSQQIAEKTERNKPFTETYQPQLLDDGLYFDDGQIRDEVFVYGSFKQSKMSEAGVTCSNCHNTHTNELKAEPNQVCGQCHLSSEFETEKHTLHKAGTAGSQCVDCHMPERIYMGVDPRRDHSFKIPRPDLSQITNAPNTCSTCHFDKTDQWAVEVLDKKIGKDWRERPEFATAFHAARTESPDAVTELIRVIENDAFAPIVRGSALKKLGSYLSGQTLQTIAKALNAPSPLVKQGALEALTNLPVQYKSRLLPPLLEDESRLVRQLTGRLLSDVPAAHIPLQLNQAKQNAVNDYIAAQRLSQDRGTARINLGQVYTLMNRYAEAEREYLEAIELEPWLTAAYVNLADLYRQQNRKKDESSILQKGLEKSVDKALLNHTLGLYLVRQKDYQGALVYLNNAVVKNPDNARYVYVYAVALNSIGEKQKAINILTEAVLRFPQNREITNALMQFRQ